MSLLELLRYGLSRAGVLALVLSVPSALAASAPQAMNAEEQRWISAALGVLNFGRQQGLPVDVIVQPQDSPEMSPVAMGLQDGRCKVVFSMRGNPAMVSLRASIPETLFTPLAQAVIAHELAHCWRQVRGGWASLPSHVSELPLDAEALSTEAARREEGLADLFALAWTRQFQAHHYAAVQAWLQATRDQVEADDPAHDTRLWLRLARLPGVFDPRLPLFEQAEAVWAKAWTTSPP